MTRLLQRLSVTSRSLQGFFQGSNVVRVLVILPTMTKCSSGKWLASLLIFLMMHSAQTAILSKSSMTSTKELTIFIGAPSYHSVENILSVVRAAVTRFTRNPGLLSRRRAEENLRRRENVFIIHGRDEAKWRELKDILILLSFGLIPLFFLSSLTPVARLSLRSLNIMHQSAAMLSQFLRLTMKSPLTIKPTYSRAQCHL